MYWKLYCPGDDQWQFSQSIDAACSLLPNLTELLQQAITELFESCFPHLEHVQKVTSPFYWKGQ